MSTDYDYPVFIYKDLFYAMNSKENLPKFKPSKRKIYGSRNAIKRLKKARKEGGL